MSSTSGRPEAAARKSRQLLLAAVAAAGLWHGTCAPPDVQPPEPIAERPEITLGELDGVLSVAAAVDGVARSEDRPMVAVVSLGHAAADSRAVEVRIGERSFTLSHDGDGLHHVADGWATPLSRGGEVEAVRFADGAIRPTTVRIVEAEGCERIAWSTDWDPSGRLHTTSSERQLVICHGEDIAEWSVRDMFPAGSRELRWVASP